MAVISETVVNPFAQTHEAFGPSCNCSVIVFRPTIVDIVITHLPGICEGNVLRTLIRIVILYEGAK